MKPRWWLAFAPLGVAALLAAAIEAAARQGPVFYLRADTIALVLLAGLLLSALAAAGLLVQHRLRLARYRAAIEIGAQAADDRRRFLGRLDHELKNPLTAIRVGLANLAEAPSDGEHTTTLASLAAQTVRLSRLSADLRKLAELETRQLECDPVDVSEVLQDVVAVAQERPDAAERAVELTLPRAPWPLPVVSGDRDLLFLAFHNLLDNALKFTAAGDTIELRAYEDGAGVIVEVADTGPGIAGADLPHVWEELYRGQQARETPGSGLGLALVRAVVMRHGGTTTLRSRAGKGTVVTVHLPAAVTER